MKANDVFLKEGEQVGQIDPDTRSETRDLLEDERQFDTAEIERKGTSAITRKVTSAITRKDLP